MTEKMKMLASMPYNAVGNVELQIERDYCKDLCFAYNQILPSQVDKQQKMIRKIFGEVKGDFLTEFTIKNG
jgi:hypothetical protein